MPSDRPTNAPSCDVCQGSKRVTLSTHRTLNAVLDDDAQIEVACKTFDCPQCCMVPYRRVRATKISTAYPPEVFSKMQMPIERTLAARFGEYLYREGLIKFTTSGSADLGEAEQKITVTAHLGVVSREDARTAGAVEEVALTSAPPLPTRIRERLKMSPRAKRWDPPAGLSMSDDPITDEFDEPKDALGARFSGLEI